MMRWVIFCLTLFFILPILANDKTPPPEKGPWAGSNVQFGFVMNTGNTDSKNINGILEADYTKGKWKSDSKFAGQLNTGRKGTNKEVFSASSQEQYNFQSRNYVYIKGDGTADRFSPYDYVIIESVGLGRDVYKSEKLIITVQAGPGGRHNRETASGIFHNDLIAETDGKIIWNVTDKTVFKELLNADFGRPYNYYQSNTSITTQLVGHLGVQVAFMAQYYSRIPPLSKFTFNTDTTTTVGLVYNF